MSTLPDPLYDLAAAFPNLSGRLQGMFTTCLRRGMTADSAVAWIVKTIESDTEQALKPYLNPLRVNYARYRHPARYARAKEAERDNQLAAARLRTVLGAITRIRTQYAIPRAAPAAQSEEVASCKQESTPVRQ